MWNMLNNLADAYNKRTIALRRDYVLGRMDEKTYLDLRHKGLNAFEKREAVIKVVFA